MSMTLQQMKDNIADITENTFTDTQLDLFITQAEEAILTAIEVPALRKLRDSDTLTIGTNTLTMPSDYLRTISIALQTSAGVISYLIAKDANFLQEAYPNTTQAKPKYYGQQKADTLQFGPIPDQAYTVIHTYVAYPTSLTDSGSGGTTWLSENVPSLLLNASLVEAARFMKAEQDISANYQQMYAMSLQMYKDKNDNSQYTDHYRARGLVG
jgi:hypothetical protein